MISVNVRRLRPESRIDVMLQRLCLLAVASAAVAVEHGFHQPPLPSWLTVGGALALFVVFAVDYLLGPRIGRFAFRDQQRTTPQTALVIIGAIGALFGSRYSLLPGSWFIFEFAVVSLCMASLWKLNVALSRWLNRPGLLLPLSFLSMVVIGTLLLKLPLAVAPGRDLSWLDATFTMTSAVCVTGLVVVDTGQHFSPFGQFLIGVFIQLGGLGIIIFGSMLAMLLGERLSLRQNMSLSTMLNDQPLSNIQAMVKFIVLTTLGIELFAALCMLPLWPGEGLTLAERVGHCLFHSVSAFCNAGFALQNSSMMDVRYSFLLHGLVVPLIVIGGIGFPALVNVAESLRWQWRRRQARRQIRAGLTDIDLRESRLSLHTKLVLTMTAVLYVAGFAAIFAAELSAAMTAPAVTANAPQAEAMTGTRVARTAADASFQSVTARTAGFSSTPIDEMSTASRFTLMSLMLVGASPGGTGGGIKTTTLAVLLLSVFASLRRREESEAFGRSVSDTLVRRAGTLVLCYIGLVAVSTYLVVWSNPNLQLERVRFEVISAASTTGLSLGITDQLTPFAKRVIIATMFLGRVGPLALIGALSFATHARQPYAYTREAVVIG